MSEREKRAAEDVITSLRAVPDDAEDYIRGYLQGRIDGLKAEKKAETVLADEKGA